MISLDFSSTACWTSTSPLRVAATGTRSPTVKLDDALTGPRPPAARVQSVPFACVLRREWRFACDTVSTTCRFPSILGVLGALPHGAVRAAELTILTNQGATPGVRELAAAFERASGHKVTVVQETLDQRLASNGPADLVASNPGPIEDLVKKGKVVARTVR
jgi:hypothetical protein